ncbi:MAG: alpha/beta hydrolase [Thermodesulfobacteriota bacterium]|nr:alpha/beta hydrolase [Thermodesulfobacteriota bacterium]
MKIKKYNYKKINQYQRKNMLKDLALSLNFILLILLLTVGYIFFPAQTLGKGKIFKKDTLYVPEVKKDILYIPESKIKAHLLDIYLPENNKNAPVLMFVHGGGWRSGSKDKKVYQKFASIFARHGYVTVVPGYRLSGEAKHPAQIEDVASAFAWIYNNIYKYEGDPKKIFISGHSAGGHLVSLLALDSYYLNRVNVPEDAIKGVLALSAVFDVTMMRGQSLKKMAEPVFGTDPSVWKRVSPINYVRSGLPPFLVLYAQRDTKSLREQAKAFINALREKGNNVKTVELKHAGHLSEMLKNRGGRNPMEGPMVEFIKGLIAK